MEFNLSNGCVKCHLACIPFLTQKRNTGSDGLLSTIIVVDYSEINSSAGRFSVHKSIPVYGGFD